MSGTLYVIATPLGNLEDLSPRAVQSLKSVELIACEDTRHSRKLLTHFGIGTATTSYHEHNEATKAKSLLARLVSGSDVALISDAGTPLLSDPGFRLVRACREAGIQVLPVPGPAALAAALSISGFSGDRFHFLGFLPRKRSQRKETLEAVSKEPNTLVLYLSPHGLRAGLEQILEALGNRQGCLVREMTKLHETHYFGTLEEILHQVNAESPRGEYTLVITGSSGKKAERLPIDAAAYVLGLMELHGLSRKEAMQQAARELGMSRREIYSLVTKTE